ncbi:hypothetical protein HK104_004658, partial [Borealophlyctis nickersoniae]
MVAPTDTKKDTKSQSGATESGPSAGQKLKNGVGALEEDDEFEVVVEERGSEARMVARRV